MLDAGTSDVQQSPRGDLSERERTVAWAIWRLAESGFLERGDRELRRYAHACGIPGEAVLAQRREQPARRGGRPRQPVPEGQKKCIRCKATKPVEEFNFKNARTGLRKGWCKPCQAAYQRERYFSNGHKAGLAKSQVVLKLRHDGKVLLECAGCGEQILTGEPMHVSGTTYHQRCAPIDERGRP